LGKKMKKVKLTMDYALLGNAIAGKKRERGLVIETP
jgi:hypothetical protein